MVPENRGQPPAQPAAPIGPIVSSNLEGSVSQARTYQDLLKSAYDEELFEYWGTSELMTVKVQLLHLCCHSPVSSACLIRRSCLSWPVSVPAHLM